MLAELGQAAQGLERIPWLAACYTYGGDRSCQWLQTAECTIPRWLSEES
jgi:hypothetical protein